MNPRTRGLNRFHFTCLSCWIRRFWYGKTKDGELQRTQGVTILANHPKGLYKPIIWSVSTDRKEGMIFPPNRVCYFIMIKAGNYADTRLALRNALVKNLLSLAEFFSQI